MAKKLNIVIFDGSLKTTPFINRLAKGLVQQHNVSIVGFSSQLSTAISGVNYVSLGSSSNVFHLIKRSVSIGLEYLFAKGAVGAWIQTKLNILFLRKELLKKQNFITTINLLQPDIIHVQWPSLLPWCEFLWNSASTTSEANSIKVVLSQRGYQNNVRPFLDAVNLAYLQKTYPKISGFHSVSQEMTKSGNAIYTHPDKIDHVVYSGFDFEQLPFRKSYATHNKLQLLSIGRPHWIKGYKDAIICCKLLKEQKVDFLYKIIGAQANEELLYLIHTYGLEDYVELLPKVSQNEVYACMQHHDLLLFPSIAEGLPNVVVEAMAIGLPVISTNCGGVKDLLAEGCGDIIPTRDSKAMSHAIIQFLKRDAQAIENQRTAARRKVEVHHSEQKMVRNMEALYLKCMESVS